MVKQLRPYQEAALKSLHDWLFREGTGHPLVVAPVGSGKSLLIAEFIRRIHAEYPHTRIVMLTHIKELLTQNADELKEQYPDCDMGFYCAGLDQKLLHNDVTFASIQSIYNKLDQFSKIPELIICDECHLISHKGQTQYRKFFDAVHAINPNVKILGFTGTPFRADTGRLDDGVGKLFDGIAYEIGMDYMIDQGFLTKPVTPALATKMDVSGISIKGGDYAIGELEERINTAEINDSCVRELLIHGANRKKWLVFTAAVQHCTDVCFAIQQAGISCAMVTGETPTEERAEIIKKFRSGDIRCLVNVAVLTTGFNVPDVDLLAFMRPTRSPVLYVQMTGRGIRPVYADGHDLQTKEGRLAAIANSTKPDCMIMDFGGVVKALGPIDRVKITKKNKEKEPTDPNGPKTKICPSCAEVCASGQRYCYQCSYCFIELDHKAAENAIVSRDEPPQTFKVLSWSRRINAKPDKIPTMLVTYFCGTDRVYDTVCFNHPKGNFAHDKAMAWHKIFAGTLPMRENVQEGVDYRFYQKPELITVKRDGDFWRVIEYIFKKPEAEKAEVKNQEEDEYEIPF